MKYFWIVAALLFLQEAKAHTIAVRDVKVSVKADSAASAREEALNQAHGLAFQKLVQENFPEQTMSIPSQDALYNMINDFSIDREKSTPTSYTASLTFQFDEFQVRDWAQQIQLKAQTGLTAPRGLHSHGKGSPVKILASYGAHREWLYIKKTLENCVGVQNFSVITLSPNNATLQINYSGPMDQLEQVLLQKNILLSQQEDNWSIALSKKMFP